jgi:tetratricopeptide (TPR) repeat protein
VRASVLILMLLTACAAHRETVRESIPNPWQSKAEDLTRSGVNALDKGQWKNAQGLFEQSLQAATLTDDEQLMSLDWYNLGQAHVAGGNGQAARAAYRQAILLADGVKDAVGRQRAALALALLEEGAAVQDKAEDVSADAVLLKVPDYFPVDIHLAAARLATIRHQPDLARLAYDRVLRMAGKDRSGMLYSARAHLGLAELASADHSTADARKHLGMALNLLHRTGEPRLMLQALDMAANAEPDPTRRQQWLERASAVRRILRNMSTE